MTYISTRPIDALRLHPDAEKVPMPDADDLRNLRASLRDNGQQDPIDVTDDGVILDGRTRWNLLREQGAKSIQVRIVDIPEGHQTAYIVDRAVARRQLTAAQKRVLNDLLRVQVIEVREPRYGDVARREKAAPMHIGYSQTERAATLGVDLSSVQRWDTEPLVTANAVTRPAPTHAIDKRGRPQPLHREQPVDRKPKAIPVKVASLDRPLDMSATRNTVVANKARDRLAGALSTMAGMTDALLTINYGNARAVSTPADVAMFTGQITEIARGLRTVKNRLLGGIE